MDKTTYLPGMANGQLPAAELKPKTDREIISAIREGDTGAFRLLVEKYETRVYHHCLRIVGDREESTDLTQEVFLKVFRNIHKYEHAYAFYTWLYKITVNCCIDYLRNAKRKIKKVPLAQLDHWDQSDSGRDQEIPDETFCPESELLNMELRGILNNAVSRLSENLRSTIILKEIEGFSYAEIAAISNCSIGTVKSRMHRAREELKVTLAPYLV
jgi:RNA polymerase sigma-70 factor (ECF subfamily)